LIFNNSGRRAFLLKKYLNLIIIPSGSHKGVHQFRVSHRTIYLLLAGLVGGIISFAFLTHSYFSKMVALAKSTHLQVENRILKTKIKEFEGRIGAFQKEMERLSEFDTKMRILADLEVMDEDIRSMGVGGPREEDNLGGLDSESKKLVQKTESDLDQLLRVAKLTKSSFGEIISLLEEKRELWNHIPSIQPSSGWCLQNYGFRLDPFTGRRAFHAGVDIIAPRGTPIVASADGLVTYIGSQGGYGLCVEVDHGYGYLTRYGHCSFIKVKKGERVRRGEVIALVGTTGRTTGPHLHYEVHVSGIPTNPFNFMLSSECFD